jgi:predicted nucleic acid-binding protein
VNRTCLDAGALIAGVRGNPVPAKLILDVLDDPDRVFVASAFLRLEVLPKAIYHRNAFEVSFYRRFFALVAGWAEPIERVIELAEREAERHGFSALDALHVAAAMHLDADELITTEGPQKPIHRATGVKVVSIHPAVSR